MRHVACRTEGCGRAGIVRTVPDTAVVPDIVTRPTLYCACCGAQMSDLTDEPVTPEPEEPEEPAAAGPPRDKRRAPRNASRQPPETR